MSDEVILLPDPPSKNGTGLVATWHRTPLYARIMGGMLLGILAGIVFGEHVAALELPSKLILRLLGALASPLIMVAVVRALMHAEISGKFATRLIGLLILNTVVAIMIGLMVANVIQPGRHESLKPAKIHASSSDHPSLVLQFLDNVPKSLLAPLVEGNVIGVILIALAFGIALRRLKAHPVNTAGDVVNLLYESLVIILHWVIDVVPLGVFGIVASIIGTKGFGPFKALAWFILSVIIALLLQGCYYLIRVRIWSWVRPSDLVRGCRDALVMAFSTASSTATMPVTYGCLVGKVKLREESAGMGALVGANFNNDGTALYEAMSALFISQMLGINLGLPKQLVVVLTSIVASVGAAGIPEAGLVTMTLVFNAVGLPLEYIAILLPVDWFLDRCRTMINVMGDMNVSCILDGKQPQSASADQE